MTKNNTLIALKSHELFAKLADEQLNLLHQHSVLAHHKKGYTLLIQDEPASSAYIILSGWVKLFRETINGEEYILDILTNGHLLGEGALFHNHKYPYGAEVIEDTTCISIPLSLLESMLKQSPQFSTNMLYFLAKQQSKSEKNREHLVIQNAPQRIGCFLLSLLPQSASDGALIHLPYDKSLLAVRLGIQRETLSRGFSMMQKESYITLHGATVTIPNIKKLSQYCCTACTNPYPCE